MHRFTFNKLALFLLVFFYLSPSAQVSAQVATGEPRIQHVELRCLPTSEFVYVKALIDPLNEIRAARVYFRAVQYPMFYYVDMTLVDGVYQAVLPRPAVDTPEIVYYLEGITHSFNSSRTREIVAEVSADTASCKEKNPEAIYFPGDNPQILMNPTGVGPELAPGFVAAGIIAAGRGAGLIIGGAAAAAAAGVGAAVLISGSDTTTVPTEPGDGQDGPPGGGGTSPPPTTTTSTAPPTTASVTACFNTDPMSATIQVGGSIRLDGSCSTPRDEVNYAWDLGDQRTRDTRVITPIYREAGTFTVTLTVTSKTNPMVFDSTDRDVVVEAPSPTPGPGGPGPPPVPGFADLALTSFTGPLAPQVTPPGASNSYMANYFNNGPESEPTPQVTFIFPGPGTITLTSGGCSQSGNTVTCNRPALGIAAGGSVTISVTFPTTGFYNAIATVAGGKTDTNTGDNTQGISGGPINVIP